MKNIFQDPFKILGFLFQTIANLQHETRLLQVYKIELTDILR